MCVARYIQPTNDRSNGHKSLNAREYVQRKSIDDVCVCVPL